jgi:hypothetical protein
MHGFTMLCGVCYRPPNNYLQATAFFLDLLQCTLDKLRLNPDTLVVIIGDLNVHFDDNVSPNAIFRNRFRRWLEHNALSQIIKEPTPVTHNTATILDVIITNYQDFFVQSGTCNPPANCDHSYIHARMAISY